MDVRTPEKIFVISLHRVMTKSTDALISMLGFRTIHHPKFFNGRNLIEDVRGGEGDPERIVEVLEPLIESADAFSDIPIPTLYRHLAERWPGSRFILVHRDPMGWIQSVRKHAGSKSLSPFNRIQYGHYFGMGVKNLSQISDEQLLDMYFRHLYEVYDYFHFERREPGRLLMAPIWSPHIGEMISEFLGRSPLPMPRITNRPSPDELQTAQEWVDRCPDKSDAHYYLARNLLAIGDRKRALVELQEACKVNPHDPGPFVLMSQLLDQEGRPLDAANAAVHAINGGLHGPSLYYRAATGCFLKKHYQKAISFYMRGMLRGLAGR